MQSLVPFRYSKWQNSPIAAIDFQERNLARANEEKDFLRNMTHTGLVDRHENATNAKEMQTKLAKSVRVAINRFLSV